jgi:D-tyrosyl-tRNA(Tyr) deacylase
LRAVVQRVTNARSTPGGAIGAGLVVLLGIADGDDEAAAATLAGKVARLRIFEDDDGRFDRSLLDTGGEALVVSQFTLIADTHRATARASPTPRAPSKLSPCTSASAPSFATWASASRPGCSTPGWRSSS